MQFKQPTEKLKFLFLQDYAQLEAKYLAQIRENKQIDIELTGFCSLMCNYCCSFNSKKNNTEVISDLFFQKLDAILYKYKAHNRILIVIIGPGEPTESEHFTTAVEFVLKNNYDLKLMTNLSNIDLLTAVKAKYPAYSGKIEACVSYHIGATIFRANYETWKAHWLKQLTNFIQYGKIASINVPLSPVLFSVENMKKLFVDIESIRKIAGNEVCFTPVELHGMYQGKMYPEAYSDAERSRIADIQALLGYDNSRHGLKKEKVNVDKAKTIQLLKHSSNALNLKGLPCTMAMMHVSINLKGEMSWCQMIPEKSLGNIMTAPASLEIFETNEILCPADECGCKSSGNAHCLFPHKISLEEYYSALE